MWTEHKIMLQTVGCSSHLIRALMLFIFKYGTDHRNTCRHSSFVVSINVRLVTNLFHSFLNILGDIRKLYISLITLLVFLFDFTIKFVFTILLYWLLTVLLLWSATLSLTRMLCCLVHDCRCNVRTWYCVPWWRCNLLDKEIQDYANNLSTSICEIFTGIVL